MLSKEKEQMDLMEALRDINVLHIYSVRFFPKRSKTFNVMTENMKKIALLIVSKRKTYEFAPEELREVYEKFKMYLPSDISSEKRTIIEDAINIFVTEWWKIEIITRISRITRTMIVIVSSLILFIWFFLALCWWFLFGESQFYIFGLLWYIIFTISYFVFIRGINKRLQEEALDVVPEWISMKIIRYVILFFIIFGPSIYSTISFYFFR